MISTALSSILCRCACGNHSLQSKELQLWTYGASFFFTIIHTYFRNWEQEKKKKRERKGGVDIVEVFVVTRQIQHGLAFTNTYELVWNLERLPSGLGWDLSLSLAWNFIKSNQILFLWLFQEISFIKAWATPQSTYINFLHMHKY